ncbi:hypothetical protein BC830DRAFT_881129 [Chytriomyces sp. MP71]|nr:hypothetical protein BC830DRAFT_881129 [Chytriomyces sp. MP71]
METARSPRRGSVVPQRVPPRIVPMHSGSSSGTEESSEEESAHDSDDSSSDIDDVVATNTAANATVTAMATGHSRTGTGTETGKGAGQATGLGHGPGGIGGSLPSLNTATSSPVAIAHALGQALADLAPLVASHARKPYAAGFLYLLVGPILTHKASPLSAMSKVGWAKYWAELDGARLALFPVPEALAAAPYFPNPSVKSIIESEGTPTAPAAAVLNSLKANPPLVLSMSNAMAEIMPFGFQAPMIHAESPPPPTPYDICVAVNLNPANLVYFTFRSSIAANQWVTAIRLSQFEASKINHHVTLRRLGAPTVTKDQSTDGFQEPDGQRAWKDVGLTPFKTTSVGQVKGFGTPMHFEGWVRVKVGYNPTWRVLYAVVGNVHVAGDYSDSDKRNSPLEKKENRGSFLKLFNKKDKSKRNSSMDGASDSANSTGNIYLATAGGASSFRNPDVSFYESRETYRKACRVAADGGPAPVPLFRVESVRHVFLDYISFFNDSAMDLCELDAQPHGPNQQATMARDGASFPAVKMDGVVVMAGLAPPTPKEGQAASDTPAQKSGKSFLTVAQDPRLIPRDPIRALESDTDPRPTPEFLHIVPYYISGGGGALPVLDALRWITATLGTFHLEANLIGREVELRDGDIGVSPFPSGLLRDDGSSPLAGSTVGSNVGRSREYGFLSAAVEAGCGAWGLLYLKTDEVAGLSQAPPETGMSSKKMFELVLQDKRAARRSGFSDKWAEAVARGVDARVGVEGGEVLEKGMEVLLPQLPPWIKRMLPQWTTKPCLPLLLWNLRKMMWLMEA